MGPTGRLLIGLLSAAVGCLCLTPRAAAQPAPAAASSGPATELPADLRAALETVSDFGLNFDHPAVYRLLAHVKQAALCPGHARRPLRIDDWRELLERPSDFRGLPVTVEGVLGHNRPWKHVGGAYPELGTVWQLELSRADQPIACTVLLTHDAGDLPLGATLRITGYFVMIRQYYSRTNRLRQAALLVAQGPTLVARQVARPRRSAGRLWAWLVVVLTAGLLLGWILLRRAAAGRPRDRRALRAAHSAPLSLADELAAWAAEEQPGQRQEDGASAGEEPRPR